MTRFLRWLLGPRRPPGPLGALAGLHLEQRDEPPLDPCGCGPIDQEAARRRAIATALRYLR
jgi:hypothetical protein